MMSKQEIPPPVIIRKPELTDGKSIYNLVFQCPPLEVNSLYSYLLICSHFDDTSAVAEINQELVGYTSGYINPHKSDTIFIWQVAVKKEVRDGGIAQNMLLDILKREDLNKVKYIETTVTPDNQASKSLFSRIATKMDVDIEEAPFFLPNDFGKLKHPEEHLISIGPLNLPKSVAEDTDINSLIEN